MIPCIRGHTWTRLGGLSRLHHAKGKATKIGQGAPPQTVFGQGRSHAERGTPPPHTLLDRKDLSASSHSDIRPSLSKRPINRPTSPACSPPPAAVPRWRNVKAQLTALCTNAHDRQPFAESRCILRKLSTASAARWIVSFFKDAMSSAGILARLNGESRISWESRQMP